LLFSVLSVTAWLWGYPNVVRARIQRRIGELSIKARSESEAAQVVREDVKKRRRAMATLASVLSVFQIGAVWILFAQVNTAIRLASTFRANIAILTPHVEPREIDLLNARFAAMKTKADHDAIQERLRTLGGNAGVTLR